MIETKRIPVRRTAVVMVALLGAAGLGACEDGGDVGSDDLVIESAHWRQEQAIPDFDTEPGDMTTTAQLERLADIIEAHEDLQGESVSVGESCDGGRSTEVAYVDEGGDTFSIRVEGCDRGEAGEAIDELVSEWRQAR